MSLNFYNTDKIEDFVTGRLDIDEAAQYHNQMNVDSALKDEIGLQRDIIEGVNNKRKAELKARLDNINVASKPFSKYYMAAAASLVAVGTWIGIGTFSNEDTALTELNKNEVALTTDQLDKMISRSNDKETTEASDATIADIEPQSGDVELAPINVAPEPAQALNNDIPRPDLGIDADELDDEAPTIADSKSIESKPQVGFNKTSIDAEVISSKNKFYYTYTNSELVLVGPFTEESPYVLTRSGSDDVLMLEFENKEYKIYKGKVNEKLTTE